MSEELDLQQDSITTVREFFAALGLGAVDEALELLAPDAVWRNTSLPDMRGAMVGRVLRGLERPWLGFDVRIHHIAADRDVVLTDRTDILIFGPLRVEFWVAGTFELRDGRITLWHDHFSWENLLRGVAVGAARAALGRGRQRQECSTK
ncbi:nuclear transport factor 2 family protein [Nocardia puris]|uniref:Limonene-1,2-epoxide hydrolase n=1 Tax=Nocardia puris TaxID=208602 RepID=A0A366DRL7_9NOCA|nr:limonene-1,2-epoxide hydrolase family protein [Nocardia puris]MBF6210776.1 nuclear transport factor 2 family protein [Nocardia puris]MBF6364371.1 nuclear transport factor 2 family protein [Nocardia puris]MBF6459300.1 nuclear transport factor 2 family protein [Nocardia puris]RBO92740.1 limonene-1,2-epoxide hydrolase [Nocardia puris]